jgi:tetratricopeptide (TPR) repeat protein
VTKLFLAAAAAASFAFGAAFDIAPAAAQKGEPSTPKTKKCEKGKKCLREDLSDQEIFYSGYWLARTGQYADALEILNKSVVKDERILTYIGFATRKLGDHQAAMGFYERALAMNPNYTVARAYMGEAFITRGNVAAARDQLGEIATRCGTTCAEYSELATELAKVGG